MTVVVVLCSHSRLWGCEQ